ncbi:MAG: GNAT family N-acetyltransferase [Parasphingorhabdus sp.]|uniref:GNAT family N-acetyltransferase n=1 Tax=Parasphingorhabdus sp. TaxID=2709688 RepID=UPI00326388D0
MTDIGTIEVVEVTTENQSLMHVVADDLFDAPVQSNLLQSYLAEETHWLVAALLDGVVIGKATAMVHRRPDKEDELYLDEIDVIPELRRKGIAKMILKKVLEMAEDWGCEECWLGTEKDNIPARKLYESNGAKPEDFVLYYLEY